MQLNPVSAALVGGSDLGTQVFVFEPDASGSGTFAELTGAIGPGFGNPRNKYSWSAEIYDGDGDGVAELYVGTLNSQFDPVGTAALVLRLAALIETGTVGDDIPAILGGEYPAVVDTDGGEIWRFDFATGTWTQVVGPDLVPAIDDGDSGFREMAVFDGRLHASTSNGFAFDLISAGDNPAKILVSDDGTEWTALSGGPLDPAEGNSSIRSMDVVHAANGQELLLVGTENTDGAQIWTLDSAGHWAKVATLPASAHAETLVFDGGIYLGSWLPYGFFRLDLDTRSAATLTDLTPQNVELGDQGVLQINEFRGQLYLGSVNYLGGASLFRTSDPDDPTAWEIVTTDGFQTDGAGDELLDDELAALGVEQSFYTWQSAVIGGTFYIGDFNAVRGLLLASEDGLDWRIVSDDTEFGESAYGIRSLVEVGLDANGLPDASIAPNALLIGSADPFWELVPLENQLPDGAIIVATMPSQAISGTPREDLLVGGVGSNFITGGAEDDWIFGDAAGFLLLGGPDVIDGGDGRDRILGGIGADTIDGGADDDLIVGGIGADLIEGGAGADFILGDIALGDLTGDILAAILPLLEGLPLPPIGAGGPLPGGPLAVETVQGGPVAPVAGTGSLLDPTLAARFPGLGELLSVLGDVVSFDGLSRLLGQLSAARGLVPVGAEPATDDLIGALEDALSAFVPALDTVFGALLGADAEETFAIILEWYVLRSRGSETSLADAFDGPAAIFDAEVEDALFEILSVLELAPGYASFTGTASLLSGFAAAAGSMAEGKPVDVPVQLLDATVVLMAEAGEAGDAEDAQMPLGGAPAGLLGSVPGISLDGLLGPLAEPVGILLGALDAASQEVLEEGFLAAILTASGLFDDSIDAGDGPDLVFGGAGSDAVSGGAGRDIIYGDGGFDLLTGGAGDDILFGGGGNDTLVGGAGSDWMSGGTGSGDVARFEGHSDAYAIEGFADGVRVLGGAAANDDAASVSEEGPPVTIAVLANDIAPEIDTVLFDVETLVFADAELATAEAAGLGAAFGAELEIAAVDTTGTRGQVTVNPDGTIGYDPAGQFEELDAGETATDRFTYTLGNGNGGAQVTATVTVTILGAGDAGPGERSAIVARDDRATVIEDEGPVTVDVLANDTLFGPGALRVAGVTGRTEYGTVEVSPDGQGIVYRPNAAFQQLGRDETETETVAYTVVNGAGLADTALVTFTLEGRNDAPVLIGGAQRTDADSPIFFTPLFFDPDGDRVSIAALDTSALDGAADIPFFDTLFYDPAGAFDGLAAGETAIDRLTVLYSDGRGGRAAGTVEIFVEGTGPGTLAVAGAAGDDAFAFETATERRSVDGGAGADSVRLPGMLADWIFEPVAGGHRARTADPGSGALPQELLSVETVELDDATLRVVEEPAADTIYFLYALTYDRPADIPGLSSWYAAHRDGFGLGAIADAFASAPEFDDLFGAGASDADVVAALYARGLDRAGDAAGIAHWTGMLESGTLDRGDMLLAFATSREIANRHENAVDDGLLILG